MSGQQADFVVVANRLPVDLERGPDGEETGSAARAAWSPRWSRCCAAATARGSAGRGSPTPTRSRSRTTACSCTRCRCPPRTSRTTTRASPTTPSGRSTTTWSAPPSYHRHWWQAYVTVNERFAEAAAEVAAQGATVWVQDYQLQLVPGMLRELRPDLRIGFFLHIPFPPTELFMQLPWREQIVRGLLGADLVGFQTPGGARNFRRLATRLGGVTTGRDAVRGRRSATGSSSSARSRSRSTRRRWTSCRAGPRSSSGRAEIRKELGDPRQDGARRGPARLHQGHRRPAAGVRGAARRRHRSATTRCSCRSPTPSRERVEHYIRLRAEIEQTVGRINGDHGRVGQPAGALPAPVDAPRGAGGVLPGRRRHAGHAAARRDEPGGQGVRRLPARRRRRAGAVGVHRRGPGADQRAAGQPARHGRGEEGGGPGAGRCRPPRPASGCGRCAGRC